MSTNFSTFLSTDRRRVDRSASGGGQVPNSDRSARRRRFEDGEQALALGRELGE
jgi:hypothetical protein